MTFRLVVPKSVTLNDLERRNRPNGCLILPNSVAFLADCVKVVKDTVAHVPPPTAQRTEDFIVYIQSNPMRYDGRR